MPNIKDLHVNGVRRRVEADDKRSLLSILREDLELTGAKYGCGEGQCGACTVLIEDQPVRSCITEIGSIGNKKITTIEGLGQNDRMHPLQEAFLEVDAMQCGYCIPGMIMSGAGLLKKQPAPSESEIIRAMNGNICRCGTYSRILAAFMKISEQSRVMKGGGR